MNLSLRLTEVKNMVRTCGTACDIGCDHGYVSIAMIKEGRAKRVIACDVNKGPLDAADANIAAEGLSDKIETRLSDGLHNIKPEDMPDTFVIAGMGGRLMERILSEGSSLIKNAGQLVLQPQSELFLVRKWLRDNGFVIRTEKALIDEGKHYFIIDAVPGEASFYPDELQNIYDEFSESLITTNDNVLRSYLNKLLDNNNRYLEGIEGEKRSSLENRNELIKRVLSMMDEY